MDAIEALKTRRSVRFYTQKPVPRETMEELVDLARLAPSGMNVQPWEFIVVTDAETRRDIADLCEYGGFIADATACIVVAARQEAHYIADTACATTYLMVAARALGLATCWVHTLGKSNEREIAEVIGAPDELRIVCCLAVGHGEAPPPPPKRALAEVLHWERY